MANDTRSDGSVRDVKERVDRIRKRVHAAGDSPRALAAALLALLDLLADEL